MANGNGKKKRKKYYIIGGVLAGVIILAVILGFTSGSTKIDPTKLAKVEKGDLAKSVVATGKVEPITKAEIKSKASGLVKRILVDAGDRVKQGQVLVELDKEEIQARVRASRAQLEGAEASYRAAEADLERGKVDAEGPDVPLLKRAYERAQSMAKEGVVSPQQLDEAQKNYELAVNKQNIARANLTVAKSKVAQAQALVAQSRANLEQAQEEYRNSTIVAPIDGLVLSRSVEVGDAVSSILVLGSQATQVMTVGDVHQVYVKGKVDESDVGKIDLQRQARIKVESFKDKTFNGKVTRISPMGTEKDNVTTFEVRVSIDNATGELKANMTANAEIILEEHKQVLQIPEGAIMYDNDKKASVELADAKAKEGKRKIPITVGISNGAKTEVISGLNEGQQVVLQ
jgi:HlyD family secretion protein